MADLIDRQAAIDAIHEDADWLAVQGSDWQEERMERDKSILMSLPSAQPEKCEDCCNFNKTRLLIPQPERKKGKWIYNSPVTMKCDQCGFVIKDWDWHRFKFCPNCGCAMEGEEE